VPFDVSCGRSALLIGRGSLRWLASAAVVSVMVELELAGIGWWMMGKVRDNLVSCRPCYLNLI
jgi:hypothetical protein